MQLEKAASDFPLVSLIITSYNRAATVGKTIESCLQQDYTNLEVIISDNCSADNTDEVVKKYLADPRVRYSKNPVNIGMLPNFKKATNELAKGKYVVYVSSDDYLEGTSFISEAMQIIQEHQTVRMVFGGMVTYNIYADEKLRYTQSELFSKSYWEGFEVFKRFPENGFLCFGACLMTRKDLVDMNIFDKTHLNIDAECILKIMLMGDVGFVNKDVYVFVRHGANESGSMADGSHLTRLAYIDEVFEEAKTRYGASRMAEVVSWRNRMLELAIKGSLYFLRMHNPKGFGKYYSLVKEKYPDNLKTVLKDRSFFWKIKLNRSFVLLLYKVFKPGYYKQEFSGTQSN